MAPSSKRSNQDAASLRRIAQLFEAGSLAITAWPAKGKPWSLRDWIIGLACLTGRPGIALPEAACVPNRLTGCSRQQARIISHQTPAPRASPPRTSLTLIQLNSPPENCQRQRKLHRGDYTISLRLFPLVASPLPHRFHASIYCSFSTSLVIALLWNHLGRIAAERDPFHRRRRQLE